MVALSIYKMVVKFVVTGLIFLLLVFLSCLGTLGCGNKVNDIVRVKYPNCDVVKVDRLRSDYYDIVLQCGPVVKRTRLHVGSD